MLCYPKAVQACRISQSLAIQTGIECCPRHMVCSTHCEIQGKQSEVNGLEESDRCRRNKDQCSVTVNVLSRMVTERVAVVRTLSPHGTSTGDLLDPLGVTDFSPSLSDSSSFKKVQYSQPESCEPNHLQLRSSWWLLTALNLVPFAITAAIFGLACFTDQSQGVSWWKLRRTSQRLVEAWRGQIDAGGIKQRQIESDGEWTNRHVGRSRGESKCDRELASRLAGLYLV